MSILFVHSPLVGPSTWATAAEAMSGEGFIVSLPDLTAVENAHPPRVGAYVAAAADGASRSSGDLAIVGHSGAGAFLPAIAQAVGARAVTLLFVDAVLPPRSGDYHTEPQMHALLDEHTVDGRLRRWLEWWPEETTRQLVPDPAERAQLLEDMPRLPRSFYDESVRVPTGWEDDRRCGYLKLSAAYDAEFHDAGQRGWHRDQIESDHLAIRTQPDRIAAALRALLKG